MKDISKSTENDKKLKFTETEDESDFDPDYDINKKPKANKGKKHVKKIEDEEFKVECCFESNSDLSSKDEKEEETQESFQNEENESKNDHLDRLEIRNSENSDDCDFTEERPPPEPPPDQPSTSGFPRTQKNIIECRDQLTMRKDNNAYFVSNKGEPRHIGSQLLEKCGKLPNFERLQKGIVQKLRKGNQYHFVLQIEDEFMASLGETTKDIKLAIYSLHSMIKELNI